MAAISMTFRQTTECAATQTLPPPKCALQSPGYQAVPGPGGGGGVLTGLVGMVYAPVFFPSGAQLQELSLAAVHPNPVNSSTHIFVNLLFARAQAPNPGRLAFLQSRGGSEHLPGGLDDAPTDATVRTGSGYFLELEFPAPLGGSLPMYAAVVSVTYCVPVSGA